MIQKLVINKIIEIVTKQLNKRVDDKVSKIEKKLKKLEDLAHPVADFVCTECGTKAKRVKSKLKKIKEKF